MSGWTVPVRVRQERDEESGEWVPVVERWAWDLGDGCDHCDSRGLHSELVHVPADSTDGSAGEWVDWRGERITVAFGFENWNERNVHEWKGFNEVRSRGSWWVSIDGVRSMDGHHVDPLYALDAVRDAVKWLTSPDCPIIWGSDGGGWDGLIGRPVYWKDQPATIDSVIPYQGAVIVKALHPQGFTPSIYDLDDPENAIGYEDPHQIKDDIRSPSFNWYRRKPDSAFADEWLSS